MDAREQTLERLDKLIEKGDKIAKSLSKPSLYNSAAADTAGWRAQITVCVNDICGKNSPYASVLINQGQHRSIIRNVTSSLAILRSVKEDIEGGYMQTYRQQLSTEFLVDLFDQAEHLLGNGFHLAAASVAGAALENGLREMAVQSGIKLRKREDLSTLAGKLADKEIISRQAQKEVAAMADVRNPADHGELEKINPINVDWMVKNANSFLSRHQS